MTTLSGMEGVFRGVLQMSWQAGVLAGVILLAQFLLRHRLSPGWRHGLWFLLVARLLMPVTPRSALSVFNLGKWLQPGATAMAPATLPRVRAELPQSVERDWPKVQTATPQARPRVEPGVEPRTVRSSEPAVVHLSGPTPAAAPRLAKPVDWMAVAARTWWAGVLAFTLHFLWANRRFRLRLAHQEPISDPSLQRLFGQCAQSLGVKGRLLIYETAEVETPAVYGFCRKRLLLPEGLSEALSEAEMRHVFLHELAHIKRRDPELNGLLVVLQILHWFNPVVWFAFARMRADREMATDELALAHAQGQDRSSYGETVVKVLERLTCRRGLPGVVGIGESKAQIKERIRGIARGTVGARWRWAACLLSVGIAGIALTSAREDKQGIDLLSRYPTTLTKGDAAPARARRWQFSEEDIFQVSRFGLEVGNQLKVETGPGDVGIGHCADGAVWAALIPHEDGKLTSSVTTNQEPVVSIWLRFHPAQLRQLFPPDTVSGPGSASRQEQLRAIAEAKFHSSWHAGNNAMIPEPKDMTVDVDTKGGPRRFFMVDTAAKTAEYAAGFAGRSAAGPSEPAYQLEVDTNCASVTSVTPANGAREVELATELRIRFDRPMDPHHVKLEWLAGGFQPNGSIQVGADHKEFIIPVRLTPGQQQTLALNHDPQREMWARMGQKGKHESSPFGQQGFKDTSGAVANEFRWSFTTKEPPRNVNGPKPRLVSVSPPSGATTPLLTVIELGFDQPMRPPEQGFPYQEKRPFMEMGGPSLIPNFDYDPATHRVTFPALLRPDDDVRLTLKGFYSAEGVPCEPVVLHYQTGTQELDPKYVARSKAAAQDPKLRQLLASMKTARAGLKSGIEMVQTIQLGMTRNAFKSIEAQTATFKWQGAHQAYADISGPMSMAGAFILGSDGVNCWLYSENEKGEKRLDQTPANVTEQEVHLVDPFDLADRSAEQVLAEDGLVLGTSASLDGRRCYRVEKWEVSQQNFVSATKTQWWIEEETFLPRQIVSYSGNGCQVVRFDYQQLNQRLPDNAFQPPAAAARDTHPLFFSQAPAPGERRFLRINDGSGGRMSGRLGWQGAGGTTSSGLN